MAFCWYIVEGKILRFKEVCFCLLNFLNRIVILWQEQYLMINYKQCFLALHLVETCIERFFNSFEMLR